MKLIAATFLSLSLLACSGCSEAPEGPAPGQAADAGEAPDGGPACASCEAFADPVEAGGLPGELAELSGLAASRKNPGVLWAHNDSGDVARLVAFTEQGKKLAVFKLTGVTAIDWEDLAVGPCPAGSCLFVGDIGDNKEVRKDTAVYRVPEPAVDLQNPVAGVVELGGWERLPYEYPNAVSHNAETLLVTPGSGDIYVVTKKFGSHSNAYRFPQPHTPGETAKLVRVAELPVPGTDSLLTGGDVHPCGDRILLRTYGQLFELRVPEGKPFAQVFTAPAVEVPVASEQQGEAVAWTLDGKGYVTASEGLDEQLHAVRCK